MPPGGQWLMSVLRFYIVFAQQERLVEYCAYTLTYCSLCLCLDGWRLAVPLMSTSDSFWKQAVTSVVFFSRWGSAPVGSSDVAVLAFEIYISRFATWIYHVSKVVPVQSYICLKYFIPDVVPCSSRDARELGKLHKKCVSWICANSIILVVHWKTYDRCCISYICYMPWFQ